MKVTQEKLPASQIGLEIEIPAETAQKAYEQTIQKFMRQANIPGFRKGKVPRQVIMQRFGASGIKAATLEDLIDDTLQAAIKQEEIKAIGNFQLRTSFEELIQKFEPGSALTFSAAVDVQPDVTLKQYKGLSIQAEEVKYKPERVDETIESSRERVATLVPVENRSAQKKDLAVIDFKGVVPSDEEGGEPVEFPGNSAEDFQLELEEGRFVEGFVDGIIGMNPGETKEVNATFPASYPLELVAGKVATFTVTLKELKEKELPELDDDLAQEISEFETMAELRESLEKRFSKEAEDQTNANKEEAILDALLEQVEADLPETLIEREANYMLNQTAMELQNRGIDLRQIFTQESIPKFREEVRPDAIARIKRTLALGEVAKKESLEVSAEEVNAKIKEILTGLQDASSIDQDRLREVVSEDLLREKIVDWLLSNATVELVPEGTLQKAEEVAEPAADEAIEVTAESVETPVVEPEADVKPVADATEEAEAEKGETKPAKKSKKSKKEAKSESSESTEE
ncbi:MAG TPA: trigger factor [Leptolyngbyaceae cyanobacterium M33_DOE_097]|uniref:Trigger factor n=1 Tax=Oscillatoriales cyanobacterium SpSt-418 TaxID=2282169 RepID=A0A7C3PJ23_9CYAN|nr:trigger factor [Leptolyngbyaceae cyanobacterium M33_DOE_097]